MEFLLNTVYDALSEIADTEQVERLLNVMGDKEYSTREMMELLGLKHRPSFRDNYLLQALKLGYIKMTIPDKPNSSRQKYRKVEHVIKKT